MTCKLLPDGMMQLTIPANSKSNSIQVYRHNSDGPEELYFKCDRESHSFDCYTQPVNITVNPDNATISVNISKSIKSENGHFILKLDGISDNVQCVLPSSDVNNAATTARPYDNGTDCMNVNKATTIARPHDNGPDIMTTQSLSNSTNNGTVAGSLGLTIGTSVPGGLVVLLIIILVVYRMYRKRTSRKRTATNIALKKYCSVSTSEFNSTKLETTTNQETEENNTLLHNDHPVCPAVLAAVRTPDLPEEINSEDAIETGIGERHTMFSSVSRSQLSALSVGEITGNHRAKQAFEIST